MQNCQKQINFGYKKSFYCVTLQKMPRKTEIQAEETAVASPLRRSSRSAAVNAGTPTLTKTRSALTLENEAKGDTKTASRTRRGRNIIISLIICNISCVDHTVLKFICSLILSSISTISKFAMKSI